MSYSYLKTLFESCRAAAAAADDPLMISEIAAAAAVEEELAFRPSCWW